MNYFYIMSLIRLIENSKSLSLAKKKVLFQFAEVASDKQKNELKKVLESASRFEARFEEIKEMQKQDAAKKFLDSANKLLNS